MGIFNSLFGSTSTQKEKKILPWIQLNSLSQLDDIVEASKVKPQLIFKYSTRCGVSRMVLNQFESSYDFYENDFDLYFLDLISYRQVSNEVGYRFQVLHESPQLLVVKKGLTVAHASHGQINEVDLNQFV
jgi:bacillithiol system protein YtxJ